MVIRRRIHISGCVQGVGFRPAVYRLACRFGLTGTVSNNTQGVTLELQGKDDMIEQCIECLKTTDKPPGASIECCTQEVIDVIDQEKEFCIKPSNSAGNISAQVSADMATCTDCVQEMFDPNDVRFLYPFINCTNCGPRYSIIKTIPYDRPNTTMGSFDLCEFCAGQYGSITDRRFHAQPVACAKCGPGLQLCDSNGRVIANDNESALNETIKRLNAGEIVAVKGLGGFHLAVDAFNDQAVADLRRRKHRDHKPFALMAGSIEIIEKYAYVSTHARDVLMSTQSPIVLLPRKNQNKLSPDTARGVKCLGFMLAYTPLHHLLMTHGPEVLVMTSANLSGEPLLCKNQQAMNELKSVAHCFLLHNRDIFRQVDDSIIHFIDNNPVILRRSRGYVPVPFFLSEPSKNNILAVGADLKNTFCLVKNNQLLLSEHMGDLADARVFAHYCKSIEHFKGLFCVKPDMVVCDLHPGYLSTQFAQEQDLPCMFIQHHWAHIASCLAEHNTQGPVIGLAADGTGYGTDQAIWGGEVLIGSLLEFERFAHVDYYSLPGADYAGKEPIRPLLGLLLKDESFNWHKYKDLLLSIEPDAEKIQIIITQVQKQINSVHTSSVGRVFDAVAAILGLGNYNHFEAQLPMLLESIAADDITDTYKFLIKQNFKPVLLDLLPVIHAVIQDLQDNIPRSVISARFHNTLALAFLEMAVLARKKSQINQVVLSGGVFCNCYLSTRLIKLLKSAGFSVLFNSNVPANDGGIALGQAAIAAARIKEEGLLCV